MKAVRKELIKRGLSKEEAKQATDNFKSEIQHLLAYGSSASQVADYVWGSIVNPF